MSSSANPGSVHTTASRKYGSAFIRIIFSSHNANAWLESGPAILTATRSNGCHRSRRLANQYRGNERLMAALEGRREPVRRKHTSSRFLGSEKNAALRCDY